MLLKLIQVVYQGDNVYKYGEALLVDTTGAIAYPYNRVMYNERGNMEKREITEIKLSNGDRVCVKETIDEIWIMVQEQRG